VPINRLGGTVAPGTIINTESIKKFETSNVWQVTDALEIGEKVENSINIFPKLVRLLKTNVTTLFYKNIWLKLSKNISRNNSSWTISCNDFLTPSYWSEILANFKYRPVTDKCWCKMQFFFLLKVYNQKNHWYNFTAVNMEQIVVSYSFSIQY